MKRFFLELWQIECHIRIHISLVSWIYGHIPILGKIVSMLMDRVIMTLYGIDLKSASINVAKLSVAHPTGVLLGGNGIYSPGRVAIMAGVKFVAHSPSNIEYLAKQKLSRVFELGDNVVVGTNSVVIGPVNICDNVIIGAMSLVNKNITEPGVYVGAPLRKISEVVTDEWVNHL
jgi:serine acetyltransferase